ncbi:uncharacterized protein LOC123896453 [Trifolium pratense]|uniref:uncharacterized protein LOC123896453 n=1 Tax=Trifolium pratense TaxID=57577 RepID=UPI001E696A05|nr:uncharacterized protein LOC123896453 [Trifolium pratense]
MARLWWLSKASSFLCLLTTPYGVIVAPANATAEQSKLADESKLKDLKAKNYLFQAIDRSILETILTRDSARDIWKSMRRKYQGSTKIVRSYDFTRQTQFTVPERSRDRKKRRSGGIAVEERIQRKKLDYAHVADIQRKKSDPKTFKQLATNYLCITEHELYEKIEVLLGQVKITPAEIAEELTKDADATECLQDLIKFLQAKKMIMYLVDVNNNVRFIIDYL